MNKKHLISFILAACMLCSLSSAFAAEAGSAQDPLISKSYADGAYSTQVMASPFQNLKDSVAVLEHKLSQVNSGTMARVKNLSTTAGGKITAYTGGSFTLLSGTAKVSSLRGSLIDVTEGRVLSSGQPLSAGHRYVAGENTSATIDVTASAKLSAFGGVSVSSGSGIAFADVGADGWFYDYVVYAVEKGLINGKTSTSF